MFSSISARHARGSCLEGTAPVPLYIGPWTGLLDSLGQNVDVSAEDLGQTPFQADQAEQPDAGRWIEFRHKVDVAVRTAIAARKRAEQANMADARPPEFVRVRTQFCDDLSTVSGLDCSLRPSVTRIAMDGPATCRSLPTPDT